MSAGLIPCLFKKSAFEWSTLPRKGVNLPILQHSDHSFSVPVWGGNGVVSGIAKIGSIPVKCKVRLYEAATGVLIKAAWSNNDGTYRFIGMNTALKYTVTGSDASHSYNDVIAAEVTAV
jgi:hypothetical protein